MWQAVACKLFPTRPALWLMHKEGMGWGELMLIVVNGSVDRALGPLLFVGTRFLLSGQRLDHHVGFAKYSWGGG